MVLFEQTSKKLAIGRLLLGLYTADYVLSENSGSDSAAMNCLDALSRKLTEESYQEYLNEGRRKEDELKPGGPA